MIGSLLLIAYGIKVTDFLTKNDVKIINHTPYSPDLVPADYFLFPKVKSALSGMYFTQETFHKKLAGVSGTVQKEGFSVAF